MSYRSTKNLVDATVNLTNTRLDWKLAAEICDRANESQKDAKEAIDALVDSLKLKNENVTHLSVSLAGVIAHSCNSETKRSLFSRPFLGQISQIITQSSTSSILQNQCLEFIYNWADELGDDPDFHYLTIVRDKLKERSFIHTPKEDPVAMSKVRILEKEKDDINLAIALSLSVEQPAEKLEPSLFQVRALYNFEASDPTELQLTKGDIIDVTSTSKFTEWWEGRIGTKTGHFPSNYVERISSTVESTIPSPVDPPISLKYNSNKVAELKEIVETASRNGNSKIICNKTTQELYVDVLACKHQILRDLENHYKKMSQLIAYKRTTNRFLELCSKCESII